MLVYFGKNASPSPQASPAPEDSPSLKEKVRHLPDGPECI